mgnify:CR=1 FL=1
MKDRLFDIWFSLRAGIASKEFVSVLEQYENTYQIFSADEAELDIDSSSPGMAIIVR